MRISILFGLVACVFTTNCKTAHRASGLRGGEGLTFRSPQEAAQYVQNSCGSSKLFNRIEGESTVLFHSVPQSSSQEIARDYYAGKAAFQDNVWRLDVAFGSSMYVPYCLVGQQTLSTSNFLQAMACTENTICPGSKEAVDVSELEAFDNDMMASIGMQRSEDQGATSLSLADPPNMDRFPFKTKGCEDKDRFYHATMLTGGTLKCRPDTLYSWGPEVKISDIKRQGWSVPFFQRSINGEMKRSPIFATTDPVGSFGYGPYAIRIKLKKDVKFKVNLSNNLPAYGYCNSIEADEAKNTVIVRYLTIVNGWPNKFGQQAPGHTGSALDFIICGPGPIHSWSYGTPEHLREILKNQEVYAELRKSHPTKWHYYMEYYGKQDGVDIFDTFNIDSMNFSFAYYKENITRHRAWANDESKYEVLYNNGVEQSGHFQTDFKFYFHN